MPITKRCESKRSSLPISRLRHLPRIPHPNTARDDPFLSDKAPRELRGIEKTWQFGSFARVALLRSIQLDGAALLVDLRVPPGNDLEALSGYREERLSIRVNRQYRMCFFGQTKAPQAVGSDAFAVSEESLDTAWVELSKLTECTMAVSTLRMAGKGVERT